MNPVCHINQNGSKFNTHYVQNSTYIAHFHCCSNAFMSAFDHTWNASEKINNNISFWYGYITLKIDMYETAINRNKIKNYTIQIIYVLYFLIEFYTFGNMSRRFSWVSFCYFSCHSYDQASVNALIVSQLCTKHVRRFINFRNATFVVLMNLCQNLRKNDPSFVQKWC